MRQTLILASTMLILSGCANKEGVAPSQNPSLQSISPSTTATSEGGVMQRSLDAWLKEEWTPLTKPAPTTQSPGSTSRADSPAKEQTSATPIVPATPGDNAPFTLQKYADKWKTYQENKAKLSEGKQKEPSHVEQMQLLPVIGK